jgi:hypothetical protein
MPKPYKPSFSALETFILPCEYWYKVMFLDEPCALICIAAERDESSCSECGTVYWRD